MKTLNSLFAVVYSMVLLVSIWYTSDWILMKGASSVFDNSTEFILAALYAVALLFSVAVHIKLRNNSSDENKVCAVTTSVNIILVAYLAVATTSSKGEAGMLLLAVWVFGVVALWLMSLIFAVIALRKK